MWVSDGVASPRWTPVSPVSGEIVPCEWKLPFEMMGGEVRLPQRSAAADAPVPAEAPPAEAPAVVALPPVLAEPARQVETFRPPDDPGVADGSETDRDRRLAADG
jgi:HemY protein